MMLTVKIQYCVYADDEKDALNEMRPTKRSFPENQKPNPKPTNRKGEFFYYGYQLKDGKSPIKR